MNGPVLIDTNLLVLFVVGSVSRDLIAKHKRLNHYTPDHFNILIETIGMFSEIITVPHVLAEVSTLIRRSNPPDSSRIHTRFHDFIEQGTFEYPTSSIWACPRPEFERLGLTDALLLHICAQDFDGSTATLLTVDSDLAECASSLGYAVIDFRREYMEDC